MKRVFPQAHAALLLAVACSFPAGAAELSSDTCILEINANPEATVTIDGVNYGTAKRKFTYGSLRPGVRYALKLKVEFPGVAPDEATTVYIAGGHHIVLAAVPESDREPEVVLQTGHQSKISAMAVSADGKLIATGGDDHNVILWNAQTGDQIRTLHRLKGRITSIAFNHKGDLLSAASQTEVAVWEVKTGRHVQSLELDYSDTVKFGGVPHFTSVCFDWSGRFVAVGCEVNDYDTKPSRNWAQVSLWNVNTGKIEHTFRGAKEEIQVVSLSPNGKLLAAGTEGGEVLVWNVQSRALLHQVQHHSDRVSSLAFSPDSGSLASAARDQSAVIWNLSRQPVDYRVGLDGPDGSVEWNSDGSELLVGSGQEIVKVDVRKKSSREFAHHLGMSSGTIARYLPQQEKIVVVGGGEKMAIFDPDLTQRMIEFVHHPSLEINHFVASRANSRLVANYGDNLVVVWDIQNGQLAQRTPMAGDTAGISSEGQLVAYEADKGKVGVWSLDSNERIQQIELGADGCRSVVFGPKAAILATEEEDGIVRTWSTTTGELLTTIRHPDDYLGDMVFSPDGRQLATTAGTKLFISDPLSGRNIRQFEVKKGMLRNDGTSVDVAVHVSKYLAFHPRGHLLFVTFDHGLTEYEINSGRRVWENASYGFFKAAYSPEGDVVLAGSGEGGLLMRYSPKVAHTGRYTHDSAISGVAVDPVANLDISASRDGTIGLWDTATGNRVGRILLFDEGKDWAIVGASGLFDGSPGGRKLVRYRLGNELQVIPAERFFQDFYYPGLLAAYFRGERPIPAHRLGDKLAPLVKIVEPTAGETTVTSPTLKIRAQVSDQGGGLKPPWILHNGARLLSPPDDVLGSKTLERTFAVTLVEGVNNIEVHSASSDGSWESEPARLTVNYREPVADARLYAICIGVSEYASKPLNLQFAAQDARSFGDLFRTRGALLFGADRVHIAELTDSGGTKPRIAKAFAAAAARAKPQDTLVVFLAGHGAMVGQRYYFIPHEFAAANEKLEDDIREQGLPGDELDELINAVPALKRVVIYDTCQSGGVINLGYRSRNAFAFRGALERMSRATGSFTIAATSATEDAKEVDELRHGVLSYALLAGAGAIDGGPLKSQRLKSDDKVVEVREWFNYAQDKVPLLTRLFLGEEQFVSSSGAGTSFPILPLDLKSD